MSHTYHMYFRFFLIFLTRMNFNFAFLLHFGLHIVTFWVVQVVQGCPKSCLAILNSLNLLN